MSSAPHFQEIGYRGEIWWPRVYCKLFWGLELNEDTGRVMEGASE